MSLLCFLKLTTLHSSDVPVTAGECLSHIDYDINVLYRHMGVRKQMTKDIKERTNGQQESITGIRREERRERETERQRDRERERASLTSMTSNAGRMPMFESVLKKASRF